MPQRGSIDPNQIEPLAKGSLITSIAISGVDHSGFNFENGWLPPGADGDVLVADSTVPEGIRWAAPGGTGGAITTHSEILTDSSGPILSNGDFIYVLGVPN
jgi:hypothetical protein